MTEPAPFGFLSEFGRSGFYAHRLDLLYQMWYSGCMDKQRARLQVFLAKGAVERAKLELERAIAEAVEVGCSVREVAQDLGVPASTAQRRINEAVEAWAPHRSPGVGR